MRSCAMVLHLGRADEFANVVAKGVFGLWLIIALAVSKQVIAVKNRCLSVLIVRRCLR
jgi:hypothetical protein